jgi:putative ABC transport system permease protein
MFRNYLTVALRNLLRHRFSSLITISGMAVGLACAIFILLFIRDELSWDRWLPGTERLYQIESTVTPPGRAPQDYAMVPFPLGPAMKDEIPEVTGFTRLTVEWMTFTTGPKQFVEKVLAVDPSFFTVIRLPLVAGDPARLLAQPHSVVLSETAARKYFGDANPVGQTLQVSRPGCPIDVTTCPTDAVAYTVTGVFKDIPHNSQIAANIIIPHTSTDDSGYRYETEDWLSTDSYTYIQLAPGADPQAVLTKLEPIIDRGAGPRLRTYNIQAPGHSIEHLHLTPFLRVHLDGAAYRANLTPPGSWTTVYGVAAIGVLIMLMACFNFMNLATGQATLRAGEIAMRKTLGARRSQIVAQFLGEAVFLSLLALVFAVAAVEILLPAFDGFLERPIGFGEFTDWRLSLLVLAVTVLAGLFSGFYPALVLSGFRPALVLGGGGEARGGSGVLRTVLVVAQFAVSIGLGIATVVVFSQIDHARRLDLGFRRDNVVILFTGQLTVAANDSLMQELARHPGIEGVAQSNDIPFSGNNSVDIVRMPGQAEQITLNTMNIGPGYRAFYGIPLIAGRDFVRERADDQMPPGSDDSLKGGRNVIVNEAAAKRLGLTPRQAVGKDIILGTVHETIVGVIGDTRFSGAREPVKPMLYYYTPQDAKTLSLRIRPDRLPETLAFVDRTWHAFSPTTAVSRRFLDQDFEALYSADERQGRMFGLFVGLAIFIAVLGLFGLAAFAAGRRTREIGIRKVFGARTGDVILLLLRQFSIPVLVANLIAWPLAWWYLNGWLQGFADRIELNPLYFVGVGAAALVIAWATVFAHTARVAAANPIKALRHE